jgi:hypothetical protein
VGRERERVERLLKMLGKDPSDYWPRIRNAVMYGK